MTLLLGALGLVQLTLVGLLVLRRASFVELWVQHLVPNETLLDLILLPDERLLRHELSVSFLGVLLQFLAFGWPDISSLRLEVADVRERALVAQVRGVDLHLLNLIDDLALREVQLPPLLLELTLGGSPGLHHRRRLHNLLRKPTFGVQRLDRCDVVATWVSGIASLHLSGPLERIFPTVTVCRIQMWLAPETHRRCGALLVLLSQSFAHSPLLLLLLLRETAESTQLV